MEQYAATRANRRGPSVNTQNRVFERPFKADRRQAAACRQTACRPTAAGRSRSGRTAVNLRRRVLLACALAGLFGYVVVRGASRGNDFSTVRCCPGSSWRTSHLHVSAQPIDVVPRPALPARLAAHPRGRPRSLWALLSFSAVLRQCGLSGLPPRPDGSGDGARGLRPRPGARPGWPDQPVRARPAASSRRSVGAAVAGAMILPILRWGAIVAAAFRSGPDAHRRAASAWGWSVAAVGWTMTTCAKLCVVPSRLMFSTFRASPSSIGGDHAAAGARSARCSRLLGPRSATVPVGDRDSRT